MGREPLGLPPSGKFNTWLPRPALGTPRPGIYDPAGKLSAQLTSWVISPPLYRSIEFGMHSKQTILGSPAVSGGQERPCLPSALKLGKLAKKNVLSGQPSFGDLRCSGQSLGAKVPKVMVLTFPARPAQAHRTAPVDTNFISILLWMPLLGLRPGVAHSGDFAVHLRTIPACR
eukprot:1141013-Pelagomonas_calceolata.AAC.3